MILPKDQRMAVQRNDRIGFSWTNGGVITYTETDTPGQYCENEGVFQKGQDVTLVGDRFSNRQYSFKVNYKPVKTSKKLLFLFI